MKSIIKNIFKSLRRFFCEHEPERKYLSSRFQVRGGYVVQPWVCRCKKCGMTIYVESGRRVL